jgi:hypothetical protein
MTVTFIDFKYTSFKQPVSGFVLTSGTKGPVYGAGPGPYPPSINWTGIQNGTVDDSFLTLSGFPFTFRFAGTGYTTVFIGSNSYLTYGAGSSIFNVLSASNPAVNKIFIGSADNSYQRVSHYISGDYVRIRYEGNGSTSGTVGNPGIVYEVTHFNPDLTGGNNVVEILVGKHNRTGGLFGAANATSYISTTPTISANQSYVLVGNDTGTNFTIYSGHYMSGTDY